MSKTPKAFDAEEITLQTLSSTGQKQSNAMSDQSHERLLGDYDSSGRGSPNDLESGRNAEQLTPELDTEDDSESNFVYDNSPKGRIKRFLHKVWHGPDEPRDDPAPRIKFLLPLEELPDRLNKNIPKKIRVLALVSYFFLWFGLCNEILWPYFTQVPHSSRPSDPQIVALSCHSSSAFWRGKNAACGLDGELCPSFDNDQDVIFRCPALCDRGSWVYSLAPIGDQRIKYRGYFVGGGSAASGQEKVDDNQLTLPYRADSFPCGAGVHAGLISPFFGGCARVSYKSRAQTNFPSAKGHYGVDDSIAFNSFFPSSFFFKSLRTGPDESFSQCNDPRLLILIINMVLGLPVVYLASGCVTYWTISSVGFWTICLATDPPVTVDAMDPETFSNLISVGIERFLPACFILYVLWHSSVKRTFDPFPSESGMNYSPLTRVFLWYPLFWLGVLNNITFDRLPVDRLTIEDLKHQPGALLSVGGIATTILICAIIQAYKIWLSGRFKKYLATYLTFVAGLVVLSRLPGLTLRIHHYILAMLLIPGCATRGRTAIMFQGILLGLFLSGASRWGLAAIAETATSLNRDDPSGKIGPPELLDFNSSSGELSWSTVVSGNLTPLQKQLQEKYSSVSILVNDIERFVGDKVNTVNLRQLFQESESINTMIDAAMKQGNVKDGDGNIPIYLRVGRKIPGSHSYSDFTNAAILKWPSGELSLPKAGVT